MRGISAVPPGIVKACAGVVEAVTREPWCGYVREAEEAIGRNFADDAKAQRTRAALVEAVKRNLVNRKADPFEQLARRYGLPIDAKAFYREKMRFCRRLAELCGWV